MRLWVRQPHVEFWFYHFISGNTVSLSLGILIFSGKECLGGKEPASAGATEEVSLISGLKRSPSGGNGNLLHYSCLGNPWTEEPGGLQSIGLQRVGHDWSDLAHTHAHILIFKMRIILGLLRNLYAGQEATVRTGHGTTDRFLIGEGVCQGCILSPCLFNLYAEYTMWNAGLDEAQVSRLLGRNINNLRNADDTTLMAESKEELNSLLMKEDSEKLA